MRIRQAMAVAMVMVVQVVVVMVVVRVVQVVPWHHVWHVKNPCGHPILPI